MKHSFNTLRSTTEVIAFGGHITRLTTACDLQAEPFLTLLRLVESDTKVFFKSLECTLDDISHDSLDDFLMTRRLSEWRKLLSEFEIQVPAVGRRLASFVEFVFQPGSGRELPSEVKRIMQSLDDDIARVKVRLDEAYTGLRADMQFTESRRSINEAKTVTRLTELAFIFVPLSFCASLFSMSIYELQGGVPVWTFIITALAMVSLAYTVRLSIGSDFLNNSTRRSLERFWTRTGVRRGDSPPLITIILYTVEEVWNSGGSNVVWQIITLMFLLVVTLLPIIFMWTSTGMGTGFNSAITLLMILPVLAIFIVRLFSGEGRSSTSWMRRRDDSGNSDSGEDV